MTDPQGNDPNNAGWAAPPPPPPTGAPAPGPYDPSAGYAQQQGYGYGYGPVQQKNNGMAIAALVCGLVGLLFFNVILGPLALIFGLVGLNQINKAGGRLKGRGMAIAGIILAPFDIAIGIWALSTLD
jgi:hypothetical protein